MKIGEKPSDIEAELAAARAEIKNLSMRLAAAEQVATLFGWLGVDDTERGKAACQAWMDWSHQYGTPQPTPEWDERIRVLAARRDSIREATLVKVRERMYGGVMPAVRQVPGEVKP